jgi:subtilisin family serine protease
MIIGGRGRGAARSVLAVVGAVAMVATLVVVPPGAGSSTAGAAPRASGRADGAWVTLVSSDRVLLAEGGQRREVVAVEPGPGRGGMQFQRYTDSGDDYVVPLDALPLLNRGRLDRRLFDVNELLRFGYDDRSRGDVPLIVSGASGTPAGTKATEKRVTVDDARVTRKLPSVAAVAVREDKARASEFWDQVKGDPDPGHPATDHLAPELTRIWLDGRVHASLDKSVPQVGAPAAWAAGHTGKGAVVAVLDTGIDDSHPDLADAVVGEKDFTGNPAGARDGDGHGTHVASIVTGSGAASGGRYTGVAPDARLLVGKVLDDFGSGYESQIVAGMEWAAAAGAPVVNMSLGTDSPGDGTGVFDQAVDRLTAQTGTLFVVAAGNSGPDAQTVGSPGSADAALTVGAVDGQDALADFSSRGPRLTRPAIKPDITAPGVGIVAARAKGTTLGDPVGEDYVKLSGTSMAAPHVAGAAAILAGEHPGWKAEQLKAALVGSAAPHDGLTVYEQGAGRLDVARADTQHVYATPASVDGGVALWPHSDDKPVATPVTYHNYGTSELALDLSLAVKDPTGAPAVAGMFMISADRLIVPAGGEATVTVTTDTTGSGPDGVYGGVLIATGDGGRVTVRTPVGITKEVESYNVNLRVLDRNGQPTGSYDVMFTSLDGPFTSMPYNPSGTVVARLPKGRYFYSALVWVPGTTLVAEPTWMLDRDTTLVIDAREGLPGPGVTVDRRDAAVALRAELLVLRKTSTGPAGFGLAGPNFRGVYTRPSDTAAPAGEFRFEVTAQLARPDSNGGFTNSPYLYHVQWWDNRRVPRDLVRHVADSELAVVHSTHAATSMGGTGVRDGAVELSLPGALTEYYTPKMPWWSQFDTPDRASWTAQYSTARTFQRGRRYVEHWNQAVFGPADAAAGTPFDEPQLQRAGNLLAAWVPLWSDEAANHMGQSNFDAGHTTLYRDGAAMYEGELPGYAYVTLPPERASYRLEATATRKAPDLSSRIDAAWTFRSGHVDGSQPEPLPLLGVRFTPRLDDHNRAPSGRRFRLPVHVGRQPGAHYGTLDRVTVDVSYDDGRSWQPARLTGTGDDRTAILTHPDGPGYVSLRAHASDSADNSVEQTILRAYVLAEL